MPVSYTHLYVYKRQVYIRPVTIVPTGCAARHDDKLALVALGVIDIVRTIGIIAVVDDLISAATLALSLIHIFLSFFAAHSP